MSRRRRVQYTVLACLTAAVLIGGCRDESPTPYGKRPPMTSADGMATPPADVVVVPAGATPLATGTYNQIQFKVPDQSGAIYILDEDTKKVVMTNSIAADGGKSMTMADLGHTVQGLSTTDHYRIYFAPAQPTTAPVGGGGSGV